MTVGSVDGKPNARYQFAIGITSNPHSKPLRSSATGLEGSIGSTLRISAWATWGEGTF